MIWYITRIYYRHYVSYILDAVESTGIVFWTSPNRGPRSSLGRAEPPQEAYSLLYGSRYRSYDHIDELTIRDFPSWMCFYEPER